MDKESEQAIVATYQLMDNTNLFLALGKVEEELWLCTHTPQMKGGRTEARARFHIRVIKEEMERRRCKEPLSPAGWFKEKSLGASLGERLKAKGKVP